ncbi:MAG: hypothetical protein ACJAQX_000573 [Polaribacter sp.]
MNIKGLAAESSFTENSSINIGDLLDGAAIFVEAYIESVTLALQMILMPCLPQWCKWD